MYTLNQSKWRFTVSQKAFSDFVSDATIPILFRTLVGALLQFGIAGLGITIVALWRKESFIQYGLHRKGALFCMMCFVPYIVFTYMSGQIESYLPFQSVWVTNEVLNSAFPLNVIGMLLIAIAWGFFEGFNYVFISEKINRRYPSKSKWLNWGAMICAVLCLFIHGIIGVTAESILEMIAVFIIIYGMLLVKTYTNNAWGCVFIFVFLWNAF